MKISEKNIKTEPGKKALVKCKDEKLIKVEGTFSRKRFLDYHFK
jgi:hypothetical protein